MTDRPTLNRSNQTDLFRPEQADVPVTLIGAGGIGSVSAIALAKMGVPAAILDFDEVAGTNLASQFYRHRDVGRPKPEALAEIIDEFADMPATPSCRRYVDQPLSGLVIAAVDTMSARRAIWENVKWNPSVDLLIDGRMGGQVGVLYAIRPCDPDHVRRYEQSLFSDERAAPEPCGARAIAYTTFICGGFVAKAARDWWVKRSVTGCFRFDLDSLTFLAEW